jgi:ubiquinone/menaquinone biosynthesis C-methylase UbiE
MKNTERFSNRVADYIKYRPHYPYSVIGVLQSEVGFNKDWEVADIGSGTGISTKLFLDNGNTVYAVEPNKEMREAAEQLNAGNKKFISINGTAEQTTLEENSVQLIVAAQAFHWFDVKACRDEFERIGKPKAFVMLMWNERSLHSPFLNEYEEILFKLIPGYANAHDPIEQEKDISLLLPNGFSKHTVPNGQQLTLDGLKGRLKSSSYCPTEEQEAYASLMSEVEKLFNLYSKDGQVQFDYDCNLYIGKIN